VDPHSQPLQNGDCPVSALIEVYQDRSPIADELLLASTTVSPTNTPTDYELPVSPAQLAFGRCHLSQLKTRVTATVDDDSSCAGGVITDCCDGIELPTTLSAEFDCSSLPGVYQLTYSESLGMWVSAGNVIQLWCEAGQWTFDIVGTLEECFFYQESQPATVTNCEPLSLLVTKAAGGHGETCLCDGPVQGVIHT
jgi:hypothetical protein